MSSKQTSATSSGTSSPPAHRFDRTERDEVVDGEDRGRRIRELEEAAHPLEAAVGSTVAAHDQLRIDRHPGGQRVLVALAAGRARSRPRRTRR